MEFKHRLIKLRKQKNLYQADLAKKLGMARATYAAYEQGTRQPDFETLKRIAEYFGVTTDYLLGTNQPDQTEDEKAFEKWMNDPTVYKFYKEFSDSPDERREALLAVWEILKSRK